MPKRFLNSQRSLSRGHNSTESSSFFEHLEDRLLLAVTGMAESKAMTYALLQGWNDSGIVQGVIPEGQIQSDYTLAGGTSHASAYTDGTDPGWFGGGVGGKLRADATTSSSVVNYAGAQAQASSMVDYIVSIRRIKDLPAAFTNTIFNIPVKSHFDTQATLVGDPVGTVWETGTSQSYVEVMLSNGAQYAKGETKLDWDTAKLNADGGGEATQLDPHTFNNTLAYWASSQDSDYLSIHLSAAGSTQANSTDGSSGMIQSYTYTYVTGIEFDQAAFAAVQGAQAFPLSEYFELVYGVDTDHLPRATSNAPVCTAPTMTANSRTGGDGTTTGDLTPTFTGSATVGTKALKSGVVTLFVDGVAAGTGTVVKGVYRVTPSVALTEGIHSITVRAGASSSAMGSQSVATTIVIDTGLPRGDTMTAALGTAGVKSIKYTDGDGTTATVKLGAGTATLSFAGDALDSTLSSGTLTVSGIGLHVTNLAMAGATSAATLSFTLSNKAGSDKHIEVGAISSEGAVKTISGKGVNLLGDLTVNGAVQSLTLEDLTGSQHTISLGGNSASKAATLVFHDVADATLTVGSPVASLTVHQWEDETGPADVITTPSLGKLTVKAAFAAGLDLSGAGVLAGRTVLGTTKITGRIIGGNWFVHGSTAAISAAGIDADWLAVIDGAINSITTKSTTSGTLLALSIGKLQVTGDLDGARIALTQPVVAEDSRLKIKALGSLKVTGAMNNSSINSQGHVGSVSLGRMLDSTIFAGVDTDSNPVGTLPDGDEDFDAAAAVDSFTITGVKNQPVGFQNSFVAASLLGTVSLLNLPADGTASGGVSGQSLLKSYTRKAGTLAAKKLKGPLSEAQTIETLDSFIARLV